MSRTILVAALLLASTTHAQYAPPCGPMAPCAPGYFCQTNGVCVVMPSPAYGPGYPQAPMAPMAPQGQPRVVERPNIALIVTGAAVLGAFWISNAFIGLFAGFDLFGTAGAAWEPFRGLGFIPVLGPWVQLAVKPTRFETDDWGTWLILDGLFQAAGLTALIIAIATPSRETVFASRGGIRIAVAPSPTGLTLLGSF